MNASLALLSDALPWAATRVGASVILLLWFGLLAVFSAREMRFLAGLDARLKRICLIQHALMQLAVLLILLPWIFTRAPSVAVFSTVLAGFALLWLAGGWSVYTRYSYTSRLLNEYRSAALQRTIGASETESDSDGKGGTNGHAAG